MFPFLGKDGFVKDYLKLRFETVDNRKLIFRYFSENSGNCHITIPPENKLLNSQYF
jgi:hypothetical protein